ANFTATSANAYITTDALNAALATGAHVTVSTGGTGAGTQSGTINLNGATIGGSACGSTTCQLTLLVDGDIIATGFSSISGNFSEVRLRAGDEGSI
ncbi:hypothetical protein ACG02S_26305, partial [Roseateles sp. DC23W]